MEIVCNPQKQDFPDRVMGAGFASSGSSEKDSHYLKFPCFDSDWSAGLGGRCTCNCGVSKFESTRAVVCSPGFRLKSRFAVRSIVE